MEKRILNRRLTISQESVHSFFLWGSRQTGKTTYLRTHFPEAHFIDLLDSQEYRRFLEDPGELQERSKAHRGRLVIIDEIQKIPSLLDEVQR